MNKRNFTLAFALISLSQLGYAANPASTDWVNMRIEQLRADVSTSIAQLRSDLTNVLNQLAARIDGLEPITYTLCQQAQGGIIFSLNPQGTHGLVVATRNLTDASNIRQEFARFTTDVNPNNPNNYLDNSDGHNDYFNWRYPNLYELSAAMDARTTCPNITFPGDANLSSYWVSNVVTYPFISYSINSINGERNEYGNNSTLQYVRLIRSF